MSTRPLFPEDKCTPAVLAKMSSFHSEIVAEVRDAIAKNDVVVVGMALNPFVGRVREALTAANIRFTYLEYGSYFGEWRGRLALKLWTGWPTFPQVFVKGTFYGGNEEIRAALADGSLAKALAAT